VTIVNLRVQAHRAWSAARGSRLYAYRDLYVGQFDGTVPVGTAEKGVTAILRHAVANVPFYRGLAGLPIEQDPLAALAAFPLISKSAIRESGDQLYSADLGRRQWYRTSSGGSTGMPVTVIHDKDYLARVRAVESLGLSIFGLERGDPLFMLWGSMSDIQKNGGGLQKLARRLATNITTVNAFQMSDQAMRDTLAYLDRHQPRLIVGYSQALYELACFAERKGIAIRPQQNVVTAASGVHPFQRETISRVFGCPVYNRYGARETGMIATEVPGHEGLWVNPWTVYVEVVDGEGVRVADGTEGEIVITSLADFAMPLIRYRIGDRGVLAPLGTGPHPQSTRVLERVSGRTSDVFRLKDGTVVPGEYFVHLVGVESSGRSRPWVRSFQVVQKAVDRIIFRVVLEGTDYPRDEWERVRADVRAVCGDCQVDIEIVDEIPLLPSGKYPYTVSEVDETG
jgi:phenylacetate-CoA ligase